MNKQSKKPIVVAVSGGFDPLHIGHIRLFQAAKKLGDELVIILNNDHWLKAKRGYVFMRQEERKEMIEALTTVHKVVITSHLPYQKDTGVCVELLSIKPHIFANGGDRTLKNIPEVNVCKKIGCKMVFGVGKGGKLQSSSWLLEKHSRRTALAEQSKKFSRKKIIIFDLDGTLTQSKTTLDQEMAFLLCRLLGKKRVVVIGGGSLIRFRQQFLKHLACPKEKLKNLIIAPTSGSSMYKNKNGQWLEIYRHTFTTQERKKILSALNLPFE